MKNIFTLLLGGLLTTSAFANSVTVTFPSNTNYQVLIDGKNVNNYNYSSNTIYLNDLQFGQHSIQVYRTKRNGLFGNKNNVVYSSYFNFSAQYDLEIAIDNNGYAQMYQTRVDNYGRNNGRWNKNDRYRNGNGNYGKNNRHRDNDGDDDDDDNKDYNRGNDGYNSGGYDNSNSGYNNSGYNNNYRQAMSDYDFNQLVQKIHNQWIGKMNMARDAANSNYLNTYQARQILQIFSSESDRLELAKLSYKNIVDQQNFRQLYDLFSYQSQSELDRYVRDFRY